MELVTTVVCKSC